MRNSVRRKSHYGAKNSPKHIIGSITNIFSTPYTKEVYNHTYMFVPTVECKLCTTDRCEKLNKK